MKKVVIIIVNYNGKKYLPDLLGSIFDYEPKTVNQEIIIVDNNSPDDSVSWIKENYPKVKLLVQQENFGFAQGNNIGIEYAINNNYDYVMLLNQDTIVSEGYLDILVSKIESDGRIAAVQPKLMLYPLTDLVNSLGNVIHYLGFGYTYGHHQKIQDTSPPRFPRHAPQNGAWAEPGRGYKSNEVNYCSGAACLFKIDVLKQVGMFDKELFMYHEDLDLGWRFRLAGYQNKLVPEAVIYHKYEFSRSIQKYYYMERNRYLVIFQNYKCLTILLILPALFFMELGLFIMSIKGGWCKEKLRVYAYFLNPLNWIKLLRKRKKIQNSRIRKDKEVIIDFSGKIEHQEIESNLVKIINPFFNLYWQIIKKLIIW